MASKVSKRVMRRHSRGRSSYDLNVVPMIDMMVMLVCFLVFSAVFTRTSILEMTFASNAQAQALPDQLQLEVVVRGDRIDVADRAQGVLKSLPNIQTGYDLKALSEYLLVVKSKFQDKTDATILPESQVSYDTIVQVMDAVRVYAPKGATQVELFPQISFGDAT
jgi:biopolymer transport protein ExbD